MNEPLALRHFAPHEFRCGCGSCSWSGVPAGFNAMQQSFLRQLDECREQAGVPFVLTSTIRCPDWNRAVGGVDSSSHIGGWAADIAANTGHKRFLIVQAAMEVGFLRVGVSANFIHLDNDPEKPTHRMWTY